MRWLLCSRRALLALSSLFAVAVRALPDLAFPINSQVPPVAYASQAYSFTFSPTTFQSEKPAISYSLGNAPEWLTLDSEERTLRGTPTAGDIGPATFELKAQDEDGQIPTTITLIVLEHPNLHVGDPILSFLQKAGPISNPSTLLLKPLEQFKFQLPAEAFSGTSGSTIYYATSSDNSPLPPWIQFDEKTLRFSGTSPSLVSPSAKQQFYGIHLIATDVVGFAEVFVSFQIAISYHLLSFTAPLSTMSVTPGKRFSSPSFRQSLTVDGESIDDSSIAFVNGDLPSWTSLDPRSISISGLAPSGLESQAITLRVTDTSGNVASITLNLQSDSPAAGDETQTIDLTAAAGQYFSYTLDRISRRSTDNISADLGNATNWLSFSSQNFTLYGRVPSTSAKQLLKLDIVAENDGGKYTTQINLRIQAPQPRQTTMSSPEPQTTSSTSSKATTNPNDMTRLPAGGHATPRHIIAIVLAIVLPLLVVIALIIFLCCCRRRRAKRNGVEAQKELSARASFQEEAVPDTADLPPVVEESRISNDRPRQVTPIHVPQVELPWAPDSLQRAKNRLSKRLRMKNQSIDSGWGELLVPSQPQRESQTALDPTSGLTLPPDALAVPPPVPNYSAKRQLPNGRRLSKQRPTRSERGSKVLSTISSRAIGLPNRLSGAGHGSGAMAAPNTMASMGNRSSWQTTLASIPQAVPPQSADDKENQGLGIASAVTKPSMRLVEHSSEASDSLDIQRQRWHTDRAKDRLEGAARFSNAGSSRTTSLSKFPTTIRSPSRTISPPIPENATINSRLSQPSWSKWSGIGPAARAESGTDVRAPAPLFTQQSLRPPRDVSMASSGQFDSALSSDSQWEDENLIAEVNNNGERHWLSDGDSAAASPRLPFEPFSSSQEEVGEANQVPLSRGARLIDKRRQVSVGDDNLRRSEKSQAGSFRFI